MTILLKPTRAPSRDELAWLLLPALAAICLLGFDRFGVEHRFAALFAERLAAAGYGANEIRLAAQAWLSASCAVLFVLIPALYLLAFPQPHAWGLGLGTSRENVKLYAALFALMLPVLWLASGRDAFQWFYPLYDPPTLERWVLFELVYLSQFFCVEFFFRGPLLLRLATRFGHAAIGVMVVPYALIHIYKPIPEALGSIVAGYLLGYLALKARSIWPGVCLHVGVAFSMDLFAMIQSGRLSALLNAG